MRDALNRQIRDALNRRAYLIYESSQLKFLSHNSFLVNVRVLVCRICLGAVNVRCMIRLRRIISLPREIRLLLTFLLSSDGALYLPATSQREMISQSTKAIE